jgi:HORMA domain
MKSSIISVCQSLDNAQSFELVQILVCATMSTVVWRRRLFPLDCFKTLFYDPSNPKCSYKDFMAGADTSVSLAEKTSHYIPWAILRRGKSTGSDKLLDWIVSVVIGYERPSLIVVGVGSCRWVEEQILGNNATIHL